MTTMNRETKAVADVAREHFSTDALSDFLKRYDDQNKAVKELSGLIKGAFMSMIYIMLQMMVSKLQPKFCELY